MGLEPALGKCSPFGPQNLEPPVAALAAEPQGLLFLGRAPWGLSECLQTLLAGEGVVRGKGWQGKGLSLQA